MSESPMTSSDTKPADARQVRLELSEADIRRVKAAAGIAGVPMTVWLRRAVVERLNDLDRQTSNQNFA